MKTVDEVLFFLTAYKKAESAGNQLGFEQRLNAIFAEGQVSEESFKIIRQILKSNVTPAVSPKVVSMTTNSNSTDPCGHGGTNRVTRGC